MNVLDALIAKKLIDPREVPEINKEVASSGLSLEEILVKRGVDAAQINSAKGDYYQLPTRSLGNTDVPFQILDYIPEESAVYYKIVPLAVKDKVLEVGIVDPDNIGARDALNFISTKINMPFKLFLISDEDFDKVVQQYKGLSGEVTKALTELETELTGEGEVETQRGMPADREEVAGDVETHIIEDAPVTKIVATILRYAAEGNASDVHVEPLRERVRVRFRVDGILNTSLTLPIRVYSAVTSRIKILSNMRLDEKRKPQDGRFSAKIDGRKIDFRVSTFPTYFGEKVVMRILDQEKGVKPLDQLGLSAENMKLIRAAIEKPYGIVLISGPTGSGKTTTLYSMLKEINREEKNVLSLEDPIEYNIESVSQSQVRPEIDYTFANGLRTALRQDPDIIMVGEIRDKETAQLAIQAALTGHLVLSTIHTNNAMGVIPRLIDMGVDPYLIAPTLQLAIAQRLAATLATPKVGKKIKLEGAYKVMAEKTFEDLPPEFRTKITIPDSVYQAAPTEDSPTGMRGRIAVYEVIEMDKQLEKIILTNPTELEITKYVRAKGMLTMREDAMLKAFDGIIPIEEVNKV